MKMKTWLWMTFMMLSVLISIESVVSFSFHHYHYHHQPRSLSISRATIVADDNGNGNNNNNNNNNNKHRLPSTTVATSTSTSTSALNTITTSGNRRSFFLASAATAGIISSSVVTVAGLFSNINNNNIANAATPSSVSAGMSAFASNKVEESIEIYDSLILDDPRRKPYLWQRGLSLYYAGRFQEGADQFATDVAVNPNDTEEQIWHLLSLTKMETVGSLPKARNQKLKVGRDRRPVMRLVQQLFLEEESNKAEQTLIELTKNKTAGAASDRFYAALYLSLYYESLNNEQELSKQYMITAIGTEYAQSVGQRDPMVDVAKVAMQRRGWSLLSSSCIQNIRGVVPLVTKDTCYYEV